MTDKDQIERLKWQIAQETGLRAQMTERMETAEKAVGVLRDELRAALYDVKAITRSSNGAIARVRKKAKQQLEDSLKAENATRAALKETERELAEALTAKRMVLAKCTSLQKERDEARAEAQQLQDELNVSDSAILADRGEKTI